MSRKPPKLLPVQGANKSLQASNVAKQSDLNVSGSNSLGESLPKRSSLTRHFLNCNGSSVGKRRFPSALPSSITSAPVPVISDSKSNPVQESTSNGNVESKVPHSLSPSISSTTKVNGNISNGVSSSKPSEVPKLVNRPKSLGVVGDAPGGEDSSKDTLTVNGKKRDTVVQRNDSNLNGSQTDSAVNVVKRTSRFSQSSTVASRGIKTPPSVSLAAAAVDEKPMPALTVACEPPSQISEENSLPSSIELIENLSTTDDDVLDEPKIIRKGDTVIKSYVDEKTGRINVFEKGMKLEVCDFGSGKWYPAKVMNVNKAKQEILVHYSNWSSRYDEWINTTSSRIRAGHNTNVVRIQFEVGEKVKAIWPKDNQKYFGTVTQRLPDKEDDEFYEVLFDDGIKMKRSARQIFKLTQVDESEELPPALVKSVLEPAVKSSASPTRVTTPRRKIERKSQPTRIHSVTTPEGPDIKPEIPMDPTAPHVAGARGHFSVFDPPSGELGKRRRTVHDYSALVKGRQARASLGESGKKRPKSELSSTATSPASSVVDEPISKPTELTSKPTAETSQSKNEKKRQRSGTTTLVPDTLQPSNDKSQEITVPKLEPIDSTQLVDTPAPEPVPKKRKSVSTASVSSNVVSETILPVKPDLVPATVPHPTATPTPRRSKSSSTVPLPAPVPASDTPVQNDTKVDSGFVDESGIAIIIELNSSNGFWTCPMENCRKNFRKDNLLKMHFKHYHPELKIANATGIQNVVQMAQARTAHDNEIIDYQSWPKHLPGEHHAALNESSSSASFNPADPLTIDLPDLHIPCSKKQQKVLQPKHSPEKQSTHASQRIGDAIPESSNSVLGESSCPETLSPLMSPGVGRVRRKGRPSLNRHKSLLHSRVLKVESIDESSSGGIATIKRIKQEVGATGSEVDEESTAGDSTNSTIVSASNTPSPSISDQFSVESGGSDLVFNVPGAERDQLTEKHGGVKGRWSKGNIRRGLMKSTIRRVGPTGAPTPLFYKKRLQFHHKQMGRRGVRQKRISILSLLSSGRMRVILDALKQRSLKRKRFRAARREPEVKVDVINCICSSKNEFGLMIQCEHCLCWQHGQCFNVQDNSQLPQFYACQSCSEPKRVRLSRKYEWAEAEYYKLGKLPSLPFAPKFPKDDARILKMSTNLSASLIEVYNMCTSLKIKQRICFGPSTPELYEWSSQRPAPQVEIQKDRFNKYFKPVLRRLLLENKNDPAYQMKLKSQVESRSKLKKYSDAVDAATLTLKKKLGCRAAAFLIHICSLLINDMIRSKQTLTNEDQPNARKENSDLRRKLQAEQAFLRLRKLQETSRSNGIGSEKSSLADGPSSSNGIRRDAASNVRDFCILKKYLKRKRPIEEIIQSTLTRVSKQLPHDWKNLMKSSRQFIDDKNKVLIDDSKLKWITSVIVTFNSLRILLKQIFSENNLQKHKSHCLDFERTNSKLFDLFSIGLAEEKTDSSKKPQTSSKGRKQVRGLETIDHIVTLPVVPGFQNLPAKTPQTQLDIDEARKEILTRISSSEKAVSSKTVEDLLATASETRKAEEMLSVSETTENGENQPGSITAETSRPRMKDGSINFSFNPSIGFHDDADFGGFIPIGECDETEGYCLQIPPAETPSSPARQIGIIPVLANDRISPDICRRNLVRDILLQQHQIDTYLDKIESEIIRLSSQSRVDSTVTSMKPAELSVQKTRMIRSLDLANRLTRTVIGDNDVTDRGQSEEINASETTISDCSDVEVTSDSDGLDNTSNYTGTDTETADEGDNSGDDDLLDV